MARDEYIHVRVSREEKALVAERTAAAHLMTLSDYVREVLFVHDAGRELREMMQTAAEEMIAARSDIVIELDKARADWLEGTNQIMQQGQAGKGEILAALENKPDEKDFASIVAKLQQREEKIPVQDPLLFPACLIIAFMVGVVFS